MTSHSELSKTYIFTLWVIKITNKVFFFFFNLVFFWYCQWIVKMMKIRCLPCPFSALIVQDRDPAHFSHIHTSTLTTKSGFHTMKYWNVHHLQAHSEDTGVNGKSSCRLNRAPGWHLSGDTYTKHCKHSHPQWISGGWADFQLTNERILFPCVGEPHGRRLIFNKGALRASYIILIWNSSWVLPSQKSPSRWEELHECVCLCELLPAYEVQSWKKSS